MRFIKPLVVASAMMAMAVPSLADQSIFVLPDIGTFTDYTNPNITDTYTGDGFVGLYSAAQTGQDAFAHLLGLERTDYSRTAFQVNISSLTGATINSAFLTFDLLDGGGGQSISATSYTSNGTMGYFWDAPDNLGSVAANVANGANSIDVTSLLAASVAGNANFFGLHLQGTDDNNYIWTYTYTGFGYSADRANARLVVNFNGGTQDVPEPGTVAMLVGLGMGSLVVIRRRK